MDTDTVTLFFALLAVVAEASVATVLVLAVGRRLIPSVARVASRARAEVGPQALGLATAVALVCTAGSLYLSEVAHFTPCRLCWYQRAAMYPLVPLLAVTAVLGHRWLRRLAGGLAALGAGVSVFHLLVERYPTLETRSCDPANPCSIIWVERFGYLTIPAMALSGFALILTLLAVADPPAGDPAQEAP